MVRLALVASIQEAYNLLPYSGFSSAFLLLSVFSLSLSLSFSILFLVVVLLVVVLLVVLLVLLVVVLLVVLVDRHVTRLFIINTS